MTEQWQPIDSAPKDGSDILVYCEHSGEQFVAFWHEGHNSWLFARYAPEKVALACRPTYWMMLPDPPQQ